MHPRGSDELIAQGLVVDARHAQIIGTARGHAAGPQRDGPLTAPFEELSPNLGYAVCEFRARLELPASSSVKPTLDSKIYLALPGRTLVPPLSTRCSEAPHHLALSEQPRGLGGGGWVWLGQGLAAQTDREF